MRVWELGADEYLTKPADPDVVAHKVIALLEAGPLRDARAPEARAF